MKGKRYSPLLAGIGASFLLIGFYWIVLVGFESVDYRIRNSHEFPWHYEDVTNDKKTPHI